MRISRNTGFSLVELVVAIAVFSSLVAGVTFLTVGSYSPFVGTGNTREQERFAREALKALEIIKERTWSEIDTNDGGAAVKVLKDANGAWSIQSGTETRGSFTRDIRIATVQRNGSGDIVASGGTDDPNTKKITVTVSATGKADYVLETYLTNWESFRMFQTDWNGTPNTDIWTEGSTSWSTNSDMELPTTVPAGLLMLASSTNP